MRLRDATNRCVTLLQIVILKELKHSDGNFDETQKIELNAVKSIRRVSLSEVLMSLTSSVNAPLVCAAPANRLLQPDEVLWNSEVRAGCVWSV